MPSPVSSRRARRISRRRRDAESESIERRFAIIRPDNSSEGVFTCSFGNTRGTMTSSCARRYGRGRDAEEAESSTTTKTTMTTTSR